MREADTCTRSHQQAEHVEHLPAAAVASQASGAQHARQPQSHNRSTVIGESQQDVQLLPAAAGSWGVQLGKRAFNAVVKNKSTKGQQTSSQVQRVAAHVDMIAVGEQQQQPILDMAAGHKHRPSKLTGLFTGLFKHKKVASKAALTSAMSNTPQS